MGRTGTYITWQITFLMVVHCLPQTTPAQVGPPYDLSHAVVAGGGEGSTGTSGARTFRIDGTIGQPVAGTTSTSSPAMFELRGGFWLESLGPTAAPASISGRVMDQSGRGIRGVAISVQGSSGEARTVVTNTFGFYRIEGLPVGQAYVLSATARRRSFANNFRFIDLSADLSDENFVATP